MSPAERPQHPSSDAASCLAALMQGSPCEIYLIDAATLHFVDVNQAARDNLGYALPRLTGMTPFELAPELTAAHFAALLAQLDAGGTAPRLQTRHRRADASTYPVTLRLLRGSHDGQALIVAIGDDLSALQASAAALEQSQSRFDAIVSNTPGLVYQFVQDRDGHVAFPYLSEGCQALLDLTAAQLRQDPGLFMQLILAEDRKSYLDSLQASKAALSGWNWEGRIWIDAWKDVKWINLRASPHALATPAGAVQWEGIMTNISQSKQEQLEVRQAHARLAELTNHIEKVKEKERTRIAREIHDDLGGNLTAIKMALAMLGQRLPPASEALHERAAYIDALVDRSIEAVHRISLDLRPSMLDFGIVAALEWQSKEFEKQAGISCQFSAPRHDIDLGLEPATALFRIFQEALTNIAKHAAATRVTVRLVHTRHHVSLKITDNGCGIGQLDHAKPQSFGLRGMAERADALGGSVTLSPAPGGGTVVTIKIRLTAATEPQAHEP